MPGPLSVTVITTLSPVVLDGESDLGLTIERLGSTRSSSRSFWTTRSTRPLVGRLARLGLQ
jgi:hypothetical protein